MDVLYLLPTILPYTYYDSLDIPIPILTNNHRIRWSKPFYLKAVPPPVTISCHCPLKFNYILLMDYVQS